MQGGLYAWIEPINRKTSLLVIPSFELIIIHMKNIRLLWSRFVGEICTVNYRTPLESYGDTQISITNTAQTQWAEHSTANIRCADARFNF